jgi:hypothetical protein
MPSTASAGRQPPIVVEPSPTSCLVPSWELPAIYIHMADNELFYQMNVPLICLQIHCLTLAAIRPSELMDIAGSKLGQISEQVRNRTDGKVFRPL